MPATLVAWADAAAAERPSIGRMSQPHMALGGGPAEEKMAWSADLWKMAGRSHHMVEKRLAPTCVRSS